MYFGPDNYLGSDALMGVEQDHGRNWGDLSAILAGIRQEGRAQQGMRPVACPLCGEPLRAAQGGVMFCRFDGFGADRSGDPRSGADWGGLAAVLDSGVSRTVPVTRQDLQWGPS